MVGVDDAPTLSFHTMSTLSPPSRNPFRSNAFSPNNTGTSTAPATSPTPSFSPPPDPPPAPEPRIPERNLGVEADDPLDEPPPYTVRPSAFAGETTIEQGPRRPFQPAPSPRPQPQPQPQAAAGYNTPGESYGSRPSRRERREGRERPGGLLHQLTGALNSVVDSLNERTQMESYSGAQDQRGRWAAYPGQQQQHAPTPPQRPPPSPNGTSLAVPPPPPRHPTSPSAHSPPASRTVSSEFARDFYAVGAAEDVLRSEGGYAPPPGPPPPLPQRPSSQWSAGGSSQIPGHPSRSTEPPKVPDDGRPTSHPVVGHPLLKDGKILVYPARHECDKCHNVGYKSADPLRPCKRCWKKYAKPFAGPIAYSYAPSSQNPSSPSTSNSNSNSNSTTFQRPLPSAPPPAPPPIPPAFSLSPPPAHFAQGGYMTDHHGGFYPPPRGVGVNVDSVMGRPPPGAVVYTAGDPRIGGRLCWRCDGTGSVSFLFLERITCEVCGGIGRTFG